MLFSIAVISLCDKVPVSRERLDTLRADALYSSSWWSDLLRPSGILTEPGDLQLPPPFRKSETSYDPL